MQFITACIVFSVCCMFTSRCLVTSSNERFPYSGFPNYPVPRLPVSKSSGSQGLNLSSPLTYSLTNQIAPLHSTELHSLTILLITSRHGLHRKHRSSVTVSNFACAKICTENTASQPVHWRVLRICCLATGFVYTVIT
jgi:hypothetical protein